MKREIYFSIALISFIGFAVCLITGQALATLFTAASTFGFASAYGENKYKK